MGSTGILPQQYEEKLRFQKCMKTTQEKLIEECTLKWGCYQ